MVDDFDDFFDDDSGPPVADTRADGRLYRMPVARLSPNHVNPRKNFGTREELIDLGKSLQRRQNQSCPVVSRGAYLKLWPENSDRIGDVDYILVSGERRYRAANQVELATLDCVVNDDFAQDRKTFMEAVVSENVDRQNFDPIEEAYAVRALVDEFGTNRAVAQHFERADGWVTQRVLLTHLAPEMQALVRDKQLPLEHARALGKLARDNEWTAKRQLQWWDQKRAENTAKAKAKKATKAAEKAKGQPPAGGEASTESTGPNTGGATGSLDQGKDAHEQSFTAVKLKSPRSQASGEDSEPESTTSDSAPSDGAAEAEGTGNGAPPPQRTRPPGAITNPKTGTAAQGEQQGADLDDALGQLPLVLARATDDDVQALAEAIGANLPRTVLSGLVKELRTWL